MATETAELETLQEYADNRGVALRVDRKNGIIRGVKLLGTTSKKGRIYPPAVIAKALPMYEGLRCNIDHVDPGQRRSLRDRIGLVKNVTQRPDGLYGDFHYNPEHALAGQIAWDAENAPQNLGFSHDTRGNSINYGGKVVVESIDRVLSCDLVANPATTSSLFESADGDKSKEDYAYAPGDDPSEWKLPIHDSKHTGMAAAALSSGGFRGNQVDIPDSAKAGVKRKIRAAWKKHNPDKDEKEMPESIKESEDEEIQFGPNSEDEEIQFGPNGEILQEAFGRPGWSDAARAAALAKRQAEAAVKGTPEERRAARRLAARINGEQVRRATLSSLAAHQATGSLFQDSSPQKLLAVSNAHRIAAQRSGNAANNMERQFAAQNNGRLTPEQTQVVNGLRLQAAAHAATAGHFASKSKEPQADVGQEDVGQESAEPFQEAVVGMPWGAPAAAPAAPAAAGGAAAAPAAPAVVGGGNFVIRGRGEANPAPQLPGGQNALGADVWSQAAHRATHNLLSQYDPETGALMDQGTLKRNYAEAGEAHNKAAVESTNAADNMVKYFVSQKRLLGINLETGDVIPDTRLTVGQMKVINGLRLQAAAHDAAAKHFDSVGSGAVPVPGFAAALVPSKDEVASDDLNADADTDASDDADTGDGTVLGRDKVASDDADASNTDAMVASDDADNYTDNYTGDDTGNSEVDQADDTDDIESGRAHKFYSSPGPNGVPEIQKTIKLARDYMRGVEDDRKLDSIEKNSENATGVAVRDKSGNSVQGFHLHIIARNANIVAAMKLRQIAAEKQREYEGSPKSARSGKVKANANHLKDAAKTAREAARAAYSRAKEHYRVAYTILAKDDKIKAEDGTKIANTIEADDTFDAEDKKDAEDMLGGIRSELGQEDAAAGKRTSTDTGTGDEVASDEPNADPNADADYDANQTNANQANAGAGQSAAGPVASSDSDAGDNETASAGPGADASDPDANYGFDADSGQQVASSDIGTRDTNTGNTRNTDTDTNEVAGADDTNYGVDQADTTNYEDFSEDETMANDTDSPDGTDTTVADTTVTDTNGTANPAEEPGGTEWKSLHAAKKAAVASPKSLAASDRRYTKAAGDANAASAAIYEGSNSKDAKSQQHGLAMELQAAAAVAAADAGDLKQAALHMRASEEHGAEMLRQLEDENPEGNCAETQQGDEEAGEDIDNDADSAADAAAVSADAAEAQQGNPNELQQIDPDYQQATTEDFQEDNTMNTPMQAEERLSCDAHSASNKAECAAPYPTGADEDFASQGDISPAGLKAGPKMHKTAETSHRKAAKAWRAAGHEKRAALHDDAADHHWGAHMDLTDKDGHDDISPLPKDFRKKVTTMSESLDPTGNRPGNPGNPGNRPGNRPSNPPLAPTERQELFALRKEKQDRLLQESINTELLAAGLDRNDTTACSKIFMEDIQATTDPRIRKQRIRERADLIADAAAGKLRPADPAELARTQKVTAYSSSPLQEGADSGGGPHIPPATAPLTQRVARFIKEPSLMDSAAIGR